VTYDLLRSLGVNLIFGNPGSSELPFLRDMPSDFLYVLGLHERTAAGMALGYSVGTGKAAFANLHSIASVGNGLAAIIDAYYCHAPLIVTTIWTDSCHPTREKKAITTGVMHSGADELEVRRRDICAQHASQAQQ